MRERQIIPRCNRVKGVDQNVADLNAGLTADHDPPRIARNEAQPEPRRGGRCERRLETDDEGQGIACGAQGVEREMVQRTVRHEDQAVDVRGQRRERRCQQHLVQPRRSVPLRGVLPRNEPDAALDILKAMPEGGK